MQTTAAVVWLECEPVHDLPPDDAFLTREGFLRYSQLLSVATAKSSEAEVRNAVGKVWMPRIVGFH